jgi:alkylation response protein AidB-like acyl-CoA dehydrogenase
MHMKPVNGMQKHGRVMVGSMAGGTARTKRAVNEVLHSVHAAADEIERSRRLPEAVVAALHDTGINRLLIPAALGGLEAPISDVMDIMERIAAADGSAGWCAAIGAGSNVFAGYMPATGPARCSPTRIKATPPCSRRSARWSMTRAESR